MERLTGRKENGHAYIIGCPDFEIPKIIGLIIQRVVNKCADIEDILGNYDLDRLMEAIEKKSEYEQFIEKWEQAVEIAGSVKQLGAERVAELVEADQLIGEELWLTKWLTPNVQIVNAPIRRKVVCFSVCKNKSILLHFKDGALPLRLIGDCAYRTKEAAEASLKGAQDG